MISNIVRNVQHFGRRIVGPIQTTDSTDSMRGTVQRDCGTAQRVRDATSRPSRHRASTTEPFGMALPCGRAMPRQQQRRPRRCSPKWRAAALPAGNVLSAEQVQAVGDPRRVWDGVRDTLMDANRKLLALRDAQALPNGSEW